MSHGVDLAQVCAGLEPVFRWLAGAPSPHRYFRPGVRPVRPKDDLATLARDALGVGRARWGPAEYAARATAWAELERRAWSMRTVCSRSTLPLHRHLGSKPRYDRFLSLVLAAYVDGAPALQATYEQLASECGRSRATVWRYRFDLEADGWIGVVTHTEGSGREARNATNLYYCGPRLLGALRDPALAKELRREAEVKVYTQQRGTPPRPRPRQVELVRETEPADDCPQGAWHEPDVVDPVQDLLRQAVERAEQEPASSTDLPCGAGEERCAGPSDPPGSAHAGPPRRVFSSRIATTAADLIKLTEKTDQCAHGRSDMAPRTGAAPAPSRALPPEAARVLAALRRAAPTAPPELDEHGAEVLAGMMRQAARLTIRDPELLAALLRPAWLTEHRAAGWLAHVAAVSVCRAQGPPHVRAAARAELLRALDAMASPPASLVALRRRLEEDSS